MTTEYIHQLKKDIQEREDLLKELSKDHWLYEKQKDLLEEKKRELEGLTRLEDSLREN